MHDYHAIKALVERLSDAPEVELEGVTEVRIRAGAGFSPEALQQAYEALTPGTPLEGSRLAVEELRQEIGCSACGRRWVVSPEDIAGHLVVCPTCGALNPIEAATGLEVVEIVAA
jgi:hydrogenase nickel incorporation protein HypA/HybF